MEARLSGNHNVRTRRYPRHMTEPDSQQWGARQAIHDLVHAYCRHVDANEPERVAELFFDDCAVDYGPGLGGPIEGRETLAKTLGSGLAHFEASHHQVSNIEIEFASETRATGIAYVTAWHRFPGDTPDATVFGQYHDVFERRDGHWGFAERRILVSGEIGFGVEWNRTARRS
jgi:ketosteroid isomerase-like protein